MPENDSGTTGVGNTPSSLHLFLAGGLWSLTRSTGMFVRSTSTARDYIPLVSSPILREPATTVCPHPAGHSLHPPSPTNFFRHCHFSHNRGEPRTRSVSSRMVRRLASCVLAAIALTTVASHCISCYSVLTVPHLRFTPEKQHHGSQTVAL